MEPQTAKILEPTSLDGIRNFLMQVKYTITRGAPMRLALCILRWVVGRDQWRQHAEQEFKALGWVEGGDEMQNAICQDVLNLLAVFSTQGHSGSTAPYAINMFRKLADFKPLGPLTGEDWE